MSTKPDPRRNFLKAAGITLGATILTCAGVAAWGMSAQPGKLAEASLGDRSAGRRILVAYATKCASTGEVAIAIGNELSVAGAAVDVLPIKSLSKRRLAEGAYTGIVLGSAARMGKLLPEAVKLVEENQVSLAGLPLAYFLCCFTMHEDTPENRSIASSYLEPMRNVIQPVAEGLFVGKIDYSKLEPALRLALTTGHAPDFPEGDWRNWEAIKSWAQSLAPVLLG